MALISPADAWARIAAEIEPLAAESARRAEALGRVLTEALPATVDVPAADVSAMDGYAVGGAVEPGDVLPVAGVIAAGDPPGARVAAGTAARIMTGAPVPAGADRIVPIENTDGDRRRVRFSAGASRAEHIRRRAEIQRRGEPLLEAGQLLTAGSLSVLATHGYSEVAVHRRPSVAVLTTGDEVVPPERQPEPGQLRDSHTDFLLGACRGLGLSAESLGIAPDDPEVLAQKVRAGLGHDLLLICGGVSKGEFDFVEPVLAAAGCRTLFDAVAVQPGKPLVVARRPGGWVFGLPGNPASVMVTFWLFVRPLLRRLQGVPDGYWEGALAGTLEAALPAARDRDRFLPARLRTVGGSVRVTPLPPAGSHDLAAYGRGAGLVRVPAGARAAAAGDPCEVLPIG